MATNLDEAMKEVDKSKIESWNGNIFFRDYLKALVETGSTEEDRKAIKEEISFGLLSMDCSGLHGFGRPTLK